MRRAKIVCTIGPASRDEGTLLGLAGAGMDVARLNFSHGTHEEHAEVMGRIRRVSAAIGREVAILLDLAGPKIRLGELPEPQTLRRDDEVTLTTEDIPGSPGVLPVRYPLFAQELKAGDRFSMNDGLIHLEVLTTDGVRVRARVLTGGVALSHKGVNLPTGGGGLPSMTLKDEADLRFGLGMGVDWVSLSFVRSPTDAERPRAIMEEMGVSVPLMAKIEKRQALERIDEVIAAFDGLMVARGDLGVEVPLEDLPAEQKLIIRKANQAAKPVITATQMLLSMVSNPRPTRAEVTDVANAILDGTDAVMLSEETAMGAYPLETVSMMATIAAHAAQIEKGPRERRRRAVLHSPATEAIAWATKVVAEEIGAQAIVSPTATGATARLVSSMRPDAPIIALSSNEAALRYLAMVWGVTPRRITLAATTDELFARCGEEALASGLAARGGQIVVTAGVRGEAAGSTNLLRIMEL